MKKQTKRSVIMRKNCVLLSILMLVLCMPMYAYQYPVKDHYQLLRALRTGTIDVWMDGRVTSLSSEDVLVLQNNIIWDQDVNPDSRNSDLLVVVNRAVDMYTIDLNGHRLQRNISDPVGDESVAVISFAKRESSNPAGLTIMDSQGGGNVTAEMSVQPTGGNYPTAVIFPSNCPGRSTLIVRSGSLQGRVTGKQMSGGTGVQDVFGCITKIHGGYLDGYASFNTTSKSELSIYGGEIGGSFTMQSTSQAGVHIASGLNAQSEWVGGTLCGVTYNKSNLFSSLVPTKDTKVYLNGNASSITALNNLSASELKRSKIEIVHEYDLTINNKTVTTRNMADVLGDGKVRFVPSDDQTKGTLYLTGASLSNMTVYIPLTIVLSGNNTLNGDLISYNANIEIRTIDDHVTASTAQHTLTATYDSEVPIVLYDADLSVCPGVGLTVNGLSNNRAVECHRLSLFRCWFKASVNGTGPVVKYSSNSISDETLESGSLGGTSVSYIPYELEMRGLSILGRELTNYDLNTEIEMDGIFGRVYFTTNQSKQNLLELDGAIIDGRGKNVETIKGKLHRILYSGSCYIVNNNKPAMDLSNATQTAVERAEGSSSGHMYIISETYAVMLRVDNGIRLGTTDNDNGAVSIYGGSTGIYGNANKPYLIIRTDVDISGKGECLPTYKVSLDAAGYRVSDYGRFARFDETDGVFTDIDGKDADHVVYRRKGPDYQGGNRSYYIEVGGIMITDKSAPDVTGDATVAYDPNTNTLTFKNAFIDGSYVPALRVRNAIPPKIILKGRNTLHSQSPSGAIQTLNGDMYIEGGEHDSLLVYGYGALGFNRGLSSYTYISGGCYVKALCHSMNFLSASASAAFQTTKLTVSNSTLYVENRSVDPTNKMSLYLYADPANNPLVLEGVEIVEGEPNTPDPILIAPIGQGIEDIRVEGDGPQKVLHDGIIYILRGGKIYDARGLEIR